MIRNARLSWQNSNRLGVPPATTALLFSPGTHRRLKIGTLASNWNPLAPLSAVSKGAVFGIRVLPSAPLVGLVPALRAVGPAATTTIAGAAVELKVALLVFPVHFVPSATLEIGPSSIAPEGVNPSSVAVAVVAVCVTVSP